MRILVLFAVGCACTVALTAQAPPGLLAEVTPLVEADALWANGRFDEADAIYAGELASNPASARARFGVARALAMQSRLADALAEAQAAAAMAPTDAAIVALQGDIYERLFRYPEAAAAYEASVALVPGIAADIAGPIRSRAALLRSFKGRQPVKIEPDPLGTYTTRFRLANKKIVINARVNNTAVELVLDTGSERTTFSEATAVRAGIRTIGSTFAAGVGVPGLTRLSIGAADRIDIAGMRIGNVPISIRPPAPRAMSGIPAWQNEIFSPMALGLSTVIDYQRREVTFSRRLRETAADVRLPLRMFRLPLVRGVLNTRVPAYFVVDTGGELISISGDTATALNMTPSRRIPLRVFGMSGLDAEAFLLPGVDVDFQDIQYRNFGLAVLNLRAPSALLGFQVGGIVGHRFLSGHRVSIDLERSELSLLKQAP